MCVKKRNCPKVLAKISGWLKDPLKTCGFLAPAAFLLFTAGVSESLSVVNFILNFPVANFCSDWRMNLNLLKNYGSYLSLELQFTSLPASSLTCISEIGKKHQINVKNWVSLLVTWLFLQYFPCTQVLSSSYECPYHGLKTSNLGLGWWLIEMMIIMRW